MAGGWATMKGQSPWTQGARPRDVLPSVAGPGTRFARARVHPIARTLTARRNLPLPPNAMGWTAIRAYGVWGRRGLGTGRVVGQRCRWAWAGYSGRGRTLDPLWASRGLPGNGALGDEVTLGLLQTVKDHLRTPWPS